jgi:hypothetical protein
LLFELRVFFEHTENAKLLYLINRLKMTGLRNLGTLAFVIKFKFGNQLEITELN